jgi:hypothetical protein
MNEVTRVLSAIEKGEPRARDQLLSLVNDEPRQLPSQKGGSKRPRPTLRAKGLVHEVCLRLLDGKEVRLWESRGHPSSPRPG